MLTSPQQNTLKNASPTETEDTTAVDRLTTEDRTGKPLKPSTDSSANLDLLRSIAVLLVLGEHLFRRNQIETIGWVHVTSLGMFGVLLFFVHTSLVLMQSMERSRLEGRPLLKNFFTRRAFRIYPLSIIAVLAAVALHLDSNVNGGHGLSFAPRPGIGRIAANLLPFLYLWSRKRQIFWPLIIFWVICIYPFSIQPNIHGLSRFGIINFFPNFLGGVIAFTLPRVPRIKSYWWPLFILFLVLLFTISSATITGYVLCLALGMLIPSFAEISTSWLRVASHNIATYSYGVYLSHQFCIWFALGFLGSHSLWLKIPVLVALLAAIPVLFYHSVEKPMIQVGSTLAKAYASPPKDTRRPKLSKSGVSS